MENTFKAIFFLFVIITTQGFPISLASTYTSPIDPNTYLITDTYIDNEWGTIILYAMIISNSGLNLKIERINATASPPILLNSYQKTFTATITKPVITFFTTTFAIALMEGSNGYFSRIDKSAMVSLESSARPGVLGGIYLTNLALMCYTQTDEGVYSSPQSPSRSLMANYISGTTYPQQVALLITQSQSILLTFYKDFNYFHLRNVGSTASITSTFNTPTSVNLPESGFQCVCLSSSGNVAYVLQPSGLLIAVNNPFTSISSTISTNVTGIQQCYYDNSTNGIVMVSTSFNSSNTGQTTMKLLSLESGLVTSTFTSPTLYFKVYKTLNYMTMSSLNEIYFYNVVTSCPSSYYYDTGNSICMVCSTGCISCTSSTVCTTCGSGYTLETDHCIEDTPLSTTNETNTTSDPIDNDTYSPLSNLTIEDEDVSFYDLSIFLEYMMNNTFINGVNKIPAGRRILPFFCFLLNLDQLWLYQYHERNYGQVMTYFFQGLHKIQTEKWNLLGDEKVGEVYQLLGTSRETVESTFNTKNNYTYPTFLKIQEKGETFIIACWDFITFNLIIVILLYFLLRIGFKLLFQYRISIFLRAFSFTLYIVPLLLDGNLQYFFFIMFGQSYLGFSLNPSDKVYNVLGYLLSFAVLFLSVISCFLAYYLSRKLSKYVLDNWRTRINGLLSYSLSNAIRMIIFGSIHSLLRFDYEIQLPSLMAAEALFLMFLLYTMKAWRAHKVQFKIWFGLLFTIMRLFLLCTLFLQQSKGLIESRSSLYYLFEDILLVILSIYMVSFYFGTGLEFVYEVIDLIKRRNVWKKQQKAQRKKKKEIKKEKQKEKKAVALQKEEKEKARSKSKKNRVLKDKMKKPDKIDKIVKFRPEDVVISEEIVLQPKKIKTDKSNMKWMVVNRRY